MIADRQRDIRHESGRTGNRLSKSGVARPTQNNRIFVLNLSSLRLFIYILYLSLSLCLLILISSRLLFDCLLYHLWLLDPSVLYPPFPSPILSRPVIQWTTANRLCFHALSCETLLIARRCARSCENERT